MNRSDFTEIKGQHPKPFAITLSNGKEVSYATLQEAEDIHDRMVGGELRLYIRTETLAGYIVLKT